MFTKKIVNKVCALLPDMLSDCEGNQSIEIGEQTYFSCAKCNQGFHNSNGLKGEMKKMKFFINALILMKFDFYM